MKRPQLWFCLLILSSAPCQGESAADPLGRTDAAALDRAALVKGNTRFALDVYGQLRGGEGNLFFSPFSIHTALAMTCAGARGDTAKEIARMLHWNADGKGLHPQFRALLDPGDKRGYQLILANGLWGQKDFGFMPDFVKLARTHYGADLKEVEFKNPDAARRAINAWVADKTRQKIKDLLKRGTVDSETCLVLVNAIYFKAAWAMPFRKKYTRDGAFHISADKSAVVPMMYQLEHFRYLKGSDFQALELPYAGKDLSLVVLLPNKVDGLAAFEKKLASSFLTECVQGLRSERVHVTLPKFKVISEVNFNETLKALGMRLAFVPGQADFTGTSNRGRELFIKEVVHKTFVSVNEQGTEAVAATEVNEKKSDEDKERPPRFRADHPFVFLIRDNRSGAVLFLGRLVDPRQTMNATAK